MSNQPLISIIVPCYNVEQYLPKCIESILAQTYRNLEILLVDDGSPDRCGEICDEYAKKDSRIKVIHKPNGGLSDARNAALDVMQGEWVTCVDSDDFITPDYVATLYGLCEKYNCKLSIADWYIFPIGTNPVIPKQKIEEHFFSSGEALIEMFNQRLFDVSACIKLYHKSLFEGVRYPKGMLFEDLQTTFKTMLKCDTGVAYTNKMVYYYMFRPDSIEGAKFSENKLNSAINVFNIMNSYESSFNGDVKLALKSKLCSFCFHLVLKMPEGYQKGEVLYNYIRKVRWKVLFNRKTRIKNRLACASSFLGFKVTKALFALIDRRA